MREIIFRGKTTGEPSFWVHGYLFKATYCDGKGECTFIKSDGNSGTEVIPETVGQFTGLQDFQKVDAYEGDKLIDEDDLNGYFLIEWNDKESRFEINSYGYAMYHNEGGGEEYSKQISLTDQNLYDLSMLSEFEIIGNIHENN